MYIKLDVDGSHTTDSPGQPQTSIIPVGAGLESHLPIRGGSTARSAMNTLNDRVNNSIRAINEIIQRSERLPHELNCGVRHTHDVPSTFGHDLHRVPLGRWIVIQNEDCHPLMFGFVPDPSDEARQTEAEVMFASWKLVEDGDSSYGRRKDGQVRYFFVCWKPGDIEFFVANDEAINTLPKVSAGWEQLLEGLLVETMCSAGKPGKLKQRE